MKSAQSAESRAQTPPRVAMIFAAFVLAGPPLLFLATGLLFLGVTTASMANVGGFLLAMFDVTKLVAIYTRFFALALLLAGVVSIAVSVFKVSSPLVAGLCGGLFVACAAFAIELATGAGASEMLSRFGSFAGSTFWGFIPSSICFWIARKFSNRL